MVTRTSVQPILLRNLQNGYGNTVACFPLKWRALARFGDHSWPFRDALCRIICCSVRVHKVSTYNLIHLFEPTHQKSSEIIYTTYTKQVRKWYNYVT